MAQPKARACFFACKKLAQLLPMIQREFQRGKHGIRQQGLVPRLVAKKTGYAERAGFRMSRLTGSKQSVQPSGGRYSSSLEHWWQSSWR